jgi:hypothetical protein
VVVGCVGLLNVGGVVSCEGGKVEVLAESPTWILAPGILVVRLLELLDDSCEGVVATSPGTDERFPWILVRGRSGSVMALRTISHAFLT